MPADHLVQMANQIGAFYISYADRREGLEGVAGHLRRFWDPRMRRALFAHLDAGGGAALTPFVREAVEGHRAELEPATEATGPR